jgi:RNA polymerase sigma factor (sigma-70 family)
MNPMTDDIQLLRRYVVEGEHAAFSDLVRRNIDFVYAAALRGCRGNTALAKDATQLVFTDLSRQAKSLLGHPSVAGWLHTATRFAAMKILRAESRRQLREHQAAELQAITEDGATSIDWSRLQPVLDDAIGELRERDRMAILLRFFQGKSLFEVGASLGLGESAARSCVDRALDRLRGRLVRRGVTSTSAALGVVLGQQVSVAAPVGLASSVSGIALAQSAVAGAALIPFFAMKKMFIAAAVLVLSGELATGIVELDRKRSLELESSALASADSSSLALPLPASSNLPTTLSAGALPADVSPNDAEEITRLEKRRALLKARPAGVTEATLKPPRSVGRATPRDAMETLAAALRDKDMNTLERFAFFTDDTPENREAFMANFSPAVRTRYPTPERLAVAFSFDPTLRDPPVGGQILSMQSSPNGKQRASAWLRLQSGKETQINLLFENTPDGWALSALQLQDNASLETMRERIDPYTGDILPPKK